MANQDIRMRVKYSAEFDTSKVSEGLKDIRKQLSSSHIGEDLRKQLEQALNKVEVNIPALEKMSAKGEYNSKELETFQKLVQQVSKDMQALDKLAGEADFTKSFSAADTEKIKQFEKQLDEVENRLKTTRKEIIDAFSKSENGKINGKSNATLNNFIEQLISVPPDQIEDKLNEVVKEVESQAENTVQKLKEDFKTKADKNKIHKEDFINLIFGQDSGVTFKQGKTLDDNKDKTKIGARTVYNQIREDILALKEDASASDVEKILEKYSNFVDEYFNVPEGKQSILANIVTPEIVEAIKQFAGPEGLEKLKTLIGEENLKILADGEAEKLKITQEQAAFLKERLDGLVQSKKLTADQAKAVMNALGGMNDKIQEGSEQIKKEKAQADALNATFGGLIHRIGSTVSAMTVFNKGMQITRNAIQSVKELDAAFTQIAIVSEQSGEQAWKLFNDFNKLAKQYSITTKDLTEGAKLFYQQGLSAADTMKMVEASTVSAALGEVTMTEAANTLTAAIQGYNESAAVAMDYTDKIAKVGAVSAADFNELSASMEKTASSAYTAGIDFDHLLGYLGKMIEVTREAPANLGTAMKTIIARFEDMKKDPMAILEDGVSANKVETALASIGIALRNSEGEFRELQDVFDELGMKWQSLTRNQQAYIATVAAGSRQQSRFLALMNNYDRTLELITESQNSAGAAAQQYATYQDSIAAAQARLTASWEKLYSKIVDNDIIKFAINGLTKLIELLSHIPPSITAIGASIGALQLQQWFRGGGAKNLLEKIFGKFVTNKETGEIKKLGENIAENFVKSFKDKSIKEIANSSNIWKKLTESTEGSASNFDKLGASLKNVGTNFVTVGKAIIGFISGNWQILAVTAAVAAAIWIVTKALNANKQKYEDSIKVIKKYSEEASQLQNKINNAENLFASYDKLIGIINRTTEEQNELNSVIEGITEIYPEAITWVDDYGNKHLENIDILKDEIALEKELAKEKTRSALQKREDLLNNTDKKEWKKEDFTDIGFSDAQVDAYFTNKEKLDYYKKYYNPNGASEYNLDSILGGQKSLSSLKKDIEFLESLKGNEYDFSNYITRTIGNINEYIDYFHLNIPKLDNDLTKLGENEAFDIIVNKVGEIGKFKDDLPELIKNLEIEQENIIEHLQRDNSLKLSFLDLVYDEKAGKATTQRAIASQLQTYFSSMGVDAYNAFKESLGETSLSDYIQKIIDNIDDSDEGIKVKNLLQEALDPTTSEARLKKIYEELGKTLGESFDDSFKAAIENNRQDYVENLQNNVREQFGIDNSVPITSNVQRLTSISELGNLGVDDYYQATRLADYYEEAKKLYEEAISSGAIDGLGDAFANIDISKLDSYSQEKLKEIFAKMQEEAIYEATNEAYVKLQKEAQEFIKNTKEELGKIQSEGRISAEDYGLMENDYEGTYFDTTSGEKMVSTARVLADIEKENNELLEKTRQQYRNNLSEIEKLEQKSKDLKEIGEELTDEEKNKLRSYKEQNENLIEQYSYYKKISKTTLEAGWNTSIKLAKNYQSQLQTITKLEESMSKQGGVLFLDDMEDAMSILPEFQNRFTQLSDNTYTISAENIEAMKKEIKSEYDVWLAKEREKALIEYENAVSNYELVSKMAKAEGVIDDTNTQQFIDNNNTELESVKKQQDESLGAERQAVRQEILAHEEKDEQMGSMFVDALNEMSVKYVEFIEGLKSGNPTEILDDFVDKISSGDLSLTTPIDIELIEEYTADPDKREELIKAALEEAAERVRIAWEKLSSLKEINVPQLEKLAHDLSATGDAADKLKELEKILNDITDTLEDLDDLILDVQKDLGDISVDYNPFTDLFEAWEHEWDYYYNIKRLISQIQTQGQFIDNIISSDYASAEQKSEARKAQVGNLLAQMSANDAYITALRAGMAQTGVELMENYGEYYKIDPETGQIYQTDKNLSEINDTINERRQEIYELQKLQNEKENDLQLENAKLDALEEEKSAYEETLSIINSQLESLKENEDVTVDTTELENQKAEIEAKIEITDDSIEETKDKIEELEDGIQEIEVDITLKEQEASQLEDYVSDMEDKVSEYEEYWENLNLTIEEQQQLLQKLAESRDYYIETAIATEQELYDAIVENYQKEINEKKKQYDYLKKLDSDYLNSIKENINKEKQLREDANKQKSYQQNVQRAQLLQMDTSGAFRNELASLNKEIEKQREEFYDDLIQKQYDALENEIEKRHELYDKEVTALEERLAYMQENAFLLWESVNAIVASGTDAMMATLENTTNYINSNELARQQQRITWEDDILTTFEGTQEGLIASLVGVTGAGNELVSSYPEVEQAIDDYKLVFDDAKNAIDDYTKGIKSGTSTMVDIFDDFMTKWNDATKKFTGYADSWSEVIKALELQTEDSKNKLKDYYDDEGNAISELVGSIGDYDEQIKEVSKDIYDDFISERERYRDELKDVIDTIQSEITVAIEGAAQAIQEAADNIEFTNPTPSYGGDSDGGGSNTPTNPEPNPGGGQSSQKYKIVVRLSGQDTDGEKVGINKTLEGYSSPEEAIEAAKAFIEEFVKSEKLMAYGYQPLIPIAYAKGGLANFTGPAWLDGTKSAPERILSPRQTQLFESMVSSLEKASNNSNINSALGSSYKIGDINTNINVEKLDNETDIDTVARQVENRIMKSIRNRVSLAIA